MKLTHLIWNYFQIFALIQFSFCYISSPDIYIINNSLSVLFSDVAPPTVDLADLEQQLVHVSEELERPQQYSSWWFPRESWRNPSNLAESFIISHLLPRALTVDPQIANFVGLEYWIQHRRLDRPLFFHFDADQTLLESFDSDHKPEFAPDRGVGYSHGFINDGHANRFPTYSSIFYLTAIGGSTLILPQRISWSGVIYFQIFALFIPFSKSLANESYYESLFPPRAETDYVLIEPTKNTYAMFAGSLLHGVLPADSAHFSEKRTTFLVNFWAEHRPLEPGCILPRKKAVELTFFQKLWGSSPQSDSSPYSHLQKTARLAETEVSSQILDLDFEQLISGAKEKDFQRIPVQTLHQTGPTTVSVGNNGSEIELVQTKLDLQIGFPRFFQQSVMLPARPLPTGAYQLHKPAPLIILFIELSNDIEFLSLPLLQLKDMISAYVIVAAHSHDGSVEAAQDILVGIPGFVFTSKKEAQQHFKNLSQIAKGSNGQVLRLNPRFSLQFGPQFSLEKIAKSPNHNCIQILPSAQIQLFSTPLSFWHQEEVPTVENLSCEKENVLDQEFLWARDLVSKAVVSVFDKQTAFSKEVEILNKQIQEAHADASLLHLFVLTKQKLQKYLNSNSPSLGDVL